MNNTKPVAISIHAVSPVLISVAITAVPFAARSRQFGAR
jgi:hypothetical protein